MVSAPVDGDVSAARDVVEDVGQRQGERLVQHQAHRALARVVDEQDDRPSEHLVAEERFGDKHLPADRYHVVGFDLEYIRVG